MAVTGINWLASYPKSGSTWVRAFLAAYLAGGELDLNKLLTIGSADSHALWWQQFIPKALDEVQPHEMALFRPAALYNLLQTWAGTGHYRNPIVKTHCANLQFMGIPLFPPILTKRAIYLVRDPRDIAVSFRGFFGDESRDETIERMASDDLVLGRNAIVQPVQSWSSHVKSWLAMKTREEKQYPVMLLRYEDLLANPRKILRECLLFYKWEVREDLVDRCVQLTSFDSLRRQESEQGMVENRSQDGGVFFRRGTSGHFKDELTEAQIRKIEEDHGAMMTAMGYELEQGDHGHSPSAH